MEQIETKSDRRLHLLMSLSDCRPRKKNAIRLFSALSGSACKRRIHCVKMDYLGVNSLIEHDFEGKKSRKCAIFEIFLCNVLRIRKCSGHPYLRSTTDCDNGLNTDSIFFTQLTEVGKAVFIIDLMVRILRAATVGRSLRFQGVASQPAE